MANNESFGRTLLVAAVLCLVCSVVVSTAAVMLRPAQQFNKDLDRKSNILAAAGLMEEGGDVEALFAGVTSRVVDLETGKFTDAVALDTYDQRKASKSPELSDAIPDDLDKAKISRRVKYAVVYLIENDQGVETVILPIKGYGLWSTLYGFVALDGDFNTVAGIGFYEHAETPGLGGEVDNPNWKASWVGKKVYPGGDTSEPALSVIKGRVNLERPEAIHQIDGLSGATLTSRGVHNLIQYWMGAEGFSPFLGNLRAGEA